MTKENLLPVSFIHLYLEPITQPTVKLATCRNKEPFSVLKECLSPLPLTIRIRGKTMGVKTYAILCFVLGHNY